MEKNLNVSLDGNDVVILPAFPLTEYLHYIMLYI